MKGNFKQSLEAVLKHEGGYVDHPHDPGGATNKGITIHTLRNFRGRPVSPDDVKNISNTEVEMIYRSRYWDKCRCDDLPSGVDYCVFDYAVNSGPARGIRGLQKAIGVDVDGIMGPVTLRSSRDIPADHIIKSMCSARIAWLRRLRTWKTFGRGWARRVGLVRKLALSMAAHSPVVPIKPPDERPDLDGLRGLWAWIRFILFGK